jgi:hypothetical protein
LAHSRSFTRGLDASTSSEGKLMLIRFELMPHWLVQASLTSLAELCQAE